MSSLLRRIADAIREWFRGTLPPMSAPKKFEIENTEEPAQNDSPTSGKTFLVTGERDGGRVAAPPAGRFVLYGGTRPKRCPYCGTQDSVTRGSRRRWKCRVCDSQWR